MQWQPEYMASHRNDAGQVSLVYRLLNRKRLTLIPKLGASIPISFKFIFWCRKYVHVPSDQVEEIGLNEDTKSVRAGNYHYSQ